MIALEALSDIAAAAEAEDGAAPLDEATWRALRHHPETVTSWVQDDGFALLIDDQLSLVVRPDARGRGVAAALLTRIEADASARGLIEIVLETGDLHDAAQALYTRHGYREIPQFGQYVGEAHSVCFAKPLTAEQQAFPPAQNVR